MKTWADPYLDMIDECNSLRLSVWERDFLLNMRNRLRKHISPTVKQIAILEKIHDRLK